MNRLKIILLMFLWTITTVVISSETGPWGKKGSVATVNPAIASSAQRVLSLSGPWDFKTQDAINIRIALGNAGWGTRPVDWSNSKTINVPGSWEVQGIGDPGNSINWDPKWDSGNWTLKHIFMGLGAYHKTITIPASWKGSQVWLKVGGVKSLANIWVNHKRAALVYNYCGTEKFNITDLVTPGESTDIIALVRNDTPSRKGLFSINHRFGGFYRDVELEATGPTYINDAYVRGLFDKRAAEIHAKIDCAEGTSVKGTLLVTIKTSDGKTVAQTTKKLESVGEVVLNLPITDCQFWTPEDPFLYHAEFIMLDDTGNAVQGDVERFGVRKLEVVGRQFFLNGKPYFLRGCGDHNYDMDNIIEPPNRTKFIEHLKLYKSAGFNATRHHTHCPLPEYYEAADEVGLLLQPELPYYHDVPTEAFEFDPMRDLQELVMNYRRYTSFAIISTGNEGFLGHPLDAEMYEWVKKNDPDRIMQHQDGGRNLFGDPQMDGRDPVNRQFGTILPNAKKGEPDWINRQNSDFATGSIPNYCQGIIKPWKSGDMDFLNRPFVAHEYLNLAIKMDPRLEKRFTGIRVSPVSMDQYRALLTKTGLTEEWGAKCITSMAKLQAYYQKQGLEFARLEENCDGYFFWSIVDASIPQGSTVAAQGYLNAFWEPRADGNPPAVFRQFNGPTALLLKTNSALPIATAGDKIQTEFRISHYNGHDLPPCNLIWKIGNSEKTYIDGKIPCKSIKAGFAGLIGQKTIEIPNLEKPVKVQFTLQLEGTDIVNSWDWWLFPKREKKSLAGFVVAPDLYPWFNERYTDVVPFDNKNMKSDEVLICRPDDTILAQAIRQNCRILILSRTEVQPNVSLGWWGIGTQVGTAFVNHPVYGNFPKNNWMDPLWFRMIRQGAPDLTGKNMFGKFELLAVGEGRDSYYLYLGQTKIGDSRILQTFALELMQDTPEAMALLDTFIKYVKSDDFQPKVTQNK